MRAMLSWRPHAQQESAAHWPGVLTSAVVTLSVVAVLCAKGHSAKISAEIVTQLTADFFTRQGVAQVVLYLCNEFDRRNILQSLSADGRFQAEAPVPGNTLTGSRLLRDQAAVGVLVWPACPWARTVLEQMDGHLNGSYRWLLLDVADVEADTVVNMTAVNLRLDTELTVARRASESRWELVEVFRADPAGALQVTAVGSWSPGSGLQALHGVWHPGLALRRRHVTGVPVSEVLYMWQDVGPDITFSLLSMPRAEAQTYITPLAIHGHIFFMNVVARYNMSLTKIMSNTAPGQLSTPPGEPFDGAVGVVERGEADVKPGTIMTIDRSRCMSWAVTTWTLKTVGGFLSNSALGSIDAIFKPFHWSLWLSVSAAAASLLLLGRYFRLLEDPVGDSWANVFIRSFGTFTGQGFYESGDWMSGRLLLFVFEVFFFLVQAYYGAALVLFLLRPPPNNIRTVQDFIKSNYKGVCHDWIHTKRVVSNSSDPLVKELYEHKVQTPRGFGFASTKDALPLLKRPWVALFATDVDLYEIAYKLTAVEACRFLELDVDTMLYSALGIDKNVSFQEFMNVGTVLQLERGLGHRALRTWHQPRPSCDQSRAGDFAPVELVPLLPTLAALVLGFIVSSAVFAAERIVHRVHRGRQRRAARKAFKRFIGWEWERTFIKNEVLQMGQLESPASRKNRRLKFLELTRNYGEFLQ